MGCCTTEPCASGQGCPDADLRPASYNASSHNEIGGHSCVSDSEDVHFWTCGALDVPFMGCCSSNPCVEEDGCPKDNLAATTLGDQASLVSLLLEEVEGDDVSVAEWVSNGDGRRWNLAGPLTVVGICVAVTLVLTVASLYLMLKAL